MATSNGHQADRQIADLVGVEVAILLSLPRGQSRVRGRLLAASAEAVTVEASGGKFAGRRTVLAMGFVVSLQAVDQGADHGTAAA